MIQFLVQDMTCDHCVKHVTRAVNSVAPSASVNVDLATKAVVILGSGDRERITEAIREAGYNPLAA